MFWCTPADYQEITIAIEKCRVAAVKCLAFSNDIIIIIIIKVKYRSSLD